jgi:zinc protease
MTAPMQRFTVFKKTLPNGLTILTRPVTHIARVEAHIWYDVGAKDEALHERGMAHLIEHMLFKGTQELSESDINLISQKLTADANAFTSQDYTCYTFRLPSNSWQVALQIFADCMQNARFDKDMLASELKAVIEEMRMYRDDLQGALIEHMLAAAFPEHPYHNPIIGSKQDLCALTRDNLYAFYKKHYHPGNATLVVVGDVQPEEVFAAAEKYFSDIPAATNYQRLKHYFNDDICSKTTTLHRPTSNPWFSYLFKIPGFNEGKNHLIDIASIIFSTGKSSRLYRRLVNKEQLALDIDCTVYDLVEKGILFFGVWPTTDTSWEQIEEVLNDELTFLAENFVEDWELDAAKKRTHIDLTSLLESTEKQAFVIGNSYLSSKNASFIDDYLAAIDGITKEDIRQFFFDFLSPSLMHKGYLLPISENDAERLKIIHQLSDELEKEILRTHVRSTPVEPARLAETIQAPPQQFKPTPQPTSFTLKNGLEVLYYHNPLVPQVVGVLCLKGNHLYEEADHAGAFGMMMRVIADGTKELSPDELSQFLEEKGIHFAAGSDNLALRCLTEDFQVALDLLAGVVKNPTLRPISIEKVRNQMLSEIEELWDNPLDYIDQIARETIYQNHPYHKNPNGTLESVEAINKAFLQKYCDAFIVPSQAVLVIVGDLTGINIESAIAKAFDDWKGKPVDDIVFPAMPAFTPEAMHIPQQREQTVLGFMAPSIARSHPDYNALALLDIVVTGGAGGSPASRLFALREESGLFYMIGGSLLYGSHLQPGMHFIKTIVAPDKAEQAQTLILNTLDNVGKNGITQEELELAKNIYFASSAELFETNAQIAQTFLFLKKLNLSFNLFDKQGQILSILKLDQVNNIARKYCTKDSMGLISIGRTKRGKVVVKKGESNKKEA